MSRPIAAIVLAALSLLAVFPAAARDLTIGNTQYPSTLHPNIDSMAAKSYVHGLTQRPLTVYDARWELMCMLCTELPTFENGQAVKAPTPAGREGVKLTYKLQPGATWGDGVPVTTKDVLFTWEVGKHPQSGVGNAEMYRRILAIDAVDDKTFTMFLDRISFNYNAINDFRLLPAHLERAIFEEDPVTYRNRTKFDTEPGHPGLAFGPYRILDVTPGSRIRLQRNPTWWGPAAPFETITIKTIESSPALEANLLSGELDMIEGSLGLALDQALAFEKRHGTKYKVHYQPGLVFEHMDLALENPILADVRVRRALLMGIDRQLLTDQLFGGRQPVADTSVHPLDWVHAKDLPRTPHDPVKAAALLAEAGWQPGPGGTRRNAAGESLRLELMTTAGNRTRELVQQVLQGMWKKLGVEIVIRNEPARVLFAETLSKRRFTGMVMFAWISSPENVPRSTLNSTEIPSEQNGWSGQNYTGYRNPRADELMEAIEVELDREKRRAMWHELQRIYADDLPALPLYFRADPHIWPLWLEGIVPTGHMAPVTLWVESWRVKG